MQVDGSTGFGWNLGRKRQVLGSIWDRLQQDLTDVKALAGTSAVYRWQRSRISWCPDRLPERARREPLARLRDARTHACLSGFKLARWTTGRRSFRSVFVDEYQDTNLLQEQIYFALVKRGGAGITVVGDDDQSLYRFRGARRAVQRLPEPD